MIDFDLTSFDNELISTARQQGLIGRHYARHYDSHKNGLIPDELPEAREAPDVRHMMEENGGATSGLVILDALLFLEEVWGTVPFRNRSNQSRFLGGKLVNALGDDAQIEKWRGYQIAIALTEPGAGSDPAKIRTRAIFDESTQEWVLNGEKIFISLAHSCDAALVFARFSRGETSGMSIFIVEKNTPGFTVGPQHDKLGQRAWDTAGLLFTDCRLPAMNRLAGNMKNTLEVFNKSRPLVSAIGLGFARAALDFTRDRLLETGHDISYTASPGRVSAAVDRFLRLEALYESAYLTFVHAKWVEQTAQADKLEAAMTKANGGIVARRITQECFEILGAEAASEQHLIEMWFRDSRVCDIYEGPGEINRLIIARDLLGYLPADLA